MSFAKIAGVLALALTGSLLPAQQFARLSGPVSGFVFDEHSRAIRVIMGVPGAAYLGRPVASDLDAGSVSPDGRLAVVVNGSRIALLRLDQQTQSAIPLGEAPASFWSSVSRFAWSPDSSAVAVAGSRIAVFRRLNQSPEASWVDAPPAIAALAVTRDGAVITAAPGAVSSDGRLVVSAGEPVALAVSGSEVYIADRAAKEIIRVRNFQDSPEISLVAGGSLALQDPSALTLSADGLTLYVSDRASRSIFGIRLDTGGAIEPVTVDFEPVRLEPVSRGLFRLDARTTGQDPVQVFDASRRSVFFIPTQDLSAPATPTVED